MPMPHAVLDRQHGLLAVKRLADDRGEEAGCRLVGLARPHHDGRQPDADAVEKAAAGVIGEQQLDDGLLGAVGGERREVKVVGDRFRKRRAEHRDRRGEDQARPIAVADRADRFEERARAVEIDVVRLSRNRARPRRTPPRRDGRSRRAGRRRRRARLPDRQYRRRWSQRCRKIPRGCCGALTSISVSLSIGLPLSAPSATRRADELAPDHSGGAGDENVHAESVTLSRGARGLPISTR